MSLFNVIKKGLKAKNAPSSSRAPSAPPLPVPPLVDDELETLDDMLKIEAPILPSYKEVVTSEVYSEYHMQLTVHLTLTVSKVPLSRRDKVKLLYGLATQFSGDKIVLGGILYSLYSQLMEQNFNEKYIVIEDRRVLSGCYSSRIPLNLVREGNHQMTIDIPGITIKAILNYKSAHSIFPGEIFPECMPPLLRDIVKKLGSIQVVKAPNNRFVIL